MIKDKKKTPRAGLIQARVNNIELKEIVTKAMIYTGGDISKLVRLSVLNYRPLKRE